MQMTRERRSNQAIRKNDLVQVVTGRETGKTGRVLTILSRKDRVLVEKVNMVKRHERPSAKNRQGGIVEKEASLHLSNVLLVCSKCNRPVRVRFKKTEEGEAQRVCVKCGETIEKKKA
ncbi:MAG TPA: 50S ribosomal protein L24 [Bdellovibrionota bacterium]|nr:50S ribosomal protein L24 [Bdellovibrionota bacterium]